MRPIFAGWNAVLLVSALSASMVHAEDLNALYQRNYEAFFSRWNAQAGLATACTEIDATARFLTDATEMLGNSEVTEANAAVIEKLCLDRPACLLQAIYSLSPRDQERILRSFMASPLYHEPSELEDALRPLWQNGKYRSLHDHFRRIKANG